MCDAGIQTDDIQVVKFIDQRPYDTERPSILQVQTPGNLDELSNKFDSIIVIPEYSLEEKSIEAVIMNPKNSQKSGQVKEKQPSLDEDEPVQDTEMNE